MIKHPWHGLVHQVIELKSSLEWTSAQENEQKHHQHGQVLKKNNKNNHRHGQVLRKNNKNHHRHHQVLRKESYIITGIYGLINSLLRFNASSKTSNP
jgi:hypothetical protein